MIRSLVCIIIVLLFSCLVNAQSGKYIISNYNLMEELSLNGSIWSAVQDTSGNMLFGCDDGIVAYDGAFWMNITRNTGTVRSLIRSSRNSIYYGSVNDFGLLRHDVNSGFYQQSLASGLPDSLRDFGDLWSITEANGKLFFQATEVVFVKDADTIIHFPVKDSYHRGFVAGKNYYLNQNNSGLTVFNGQGFIPVHGGDIFANKTISTAVSLPDGKILIGTRMNGVYIFDPVKLSFVPGFEQHPQTVRYLKKNNLYHAVLLPNGRIALSTLYGGTIVTTPVGKIHHMLNRQRGLHDNVHYYLHFTPDLNLWMCTSNGIATWDINSPFIYWDYTSGIDGIVLDINKYKDRIFVGSLTGLYSIPDGFGRLNASRKVEKLLETEVWEITKVSNNKKEILLLGTGQGLYAYRNHKTEKLRPGALVLKILPLKNRPETVLAFGANKMDVLEWEGNTLQYKATVSDLFTGLRTVAEDHNGNLWIGSRKPEVVKIPIKDLLEGQATEHISRFDFNGQLTDVIPFDGKVVFSNSAGLHSFKPATGNFGPCMLFGPDIAGISQMFSCLEKDFRNNVWVGGNEIFLYHTDGTYSREKLHFHQIEEVFSAFVFFHENDQRTWIGGNNGVYLFRNNPQLAYPTNIRTVINRININNDSTVYHLNSHQWPLNQKKSQPDYPLHIDLTKNNAQVTFHFALPYFNSENKTMYSYRLKNYSDSWSGWTHDHYATFSNLKPGDYAFEVRALTINKQIAEPAMVSMHVPTPWFLTHYAIMAYILAGTGAIYFISLVISRQRVRKHLRIEDVIQKRLQEKKISDIVESVNSSTENFSDPAAGFPKTQKGKGHKKPEPGKSRQLFLEKSLEIVETHMNDPEFGVEDFCKKMGMNQAYVYRKMIAITGMTINSFIRNTRLKRAAQMLLESDLSISEVAYQTGFSAPSYFTKCFKREFGKNPREFIQSQKKSLKL